MQECIICREKKSEFSDEHVIPESIGGYYHIYSVCKTCNSNLGDSVDSNLINHKFIEFQRYLLKLKGKKGNIPNPFVGTHSIDNDSSQKVRVENDDGKFQPIILPNIKTDNILENGFTIVVDKRDEDKVQSITDKILARHGIPKEKVKTESWIENEKRPTIHIKQIIDIKNFKIGLLKIAYEFAVDNIPGYYNDPLAIEISQILKICNLERLNDIKFLGSGFDNEILKPISHFFDFSNFKKHYLILMSVQGIGLICFINLFNSISIGVLLSTDSSHIDNEFIAGINDIEEKKFEIKKATEIIASIFSPIVYKFKYHFNTNIEAMEFLANEKHPEFNYYQIGEKVPFFDKSGNVKYEHIDKKLIQPQLHRVYKGDDINSNITEVLLDEELYLKVLPLNRLCRVISVQTERYRTKKL